MYIIYKEKTNNKELILSEKWNIELAIEESNRSLSLKLDNLDRKILNKCINMIYVIDKDNIKIKLNS